MTITQLPTSLIPSDVKTDRNYKVGPHLYMSSRNFDRSILSQVDVVFNVWWKTDNLDCKPGELIYIHWPLRDGKHLPEEDLETLATLGSVFWNRGKRILCHCYGGRNRSALLAGMIMVKSGFCNGEEAYQRIKTARTSALANSKFADYLKEYHA